MTLGWPTCELMGMELACVHVEALLDHVFAELEAGKGGWIVTANVDFLRRYRLDAEVRSLYQAADIRVADGMPLLWASRLQGERLPERVPGATLVSLLAERAARLGRSLYLLGDAAEVNERAVRVLADRFPGLRLSGSSPRVTGPPTADEVAALRRDLAPLRPDVLLVGLGSPKQEQLIRELRATLPRAWMIGVGGSFGFVAGRVARAPTWLQRLGLEWTHRLAQEPRRLARRYLVEDLPFAVRLLVHAARRRVGGSSS